LTRSRKPHSVLSDAAPQGRGRDARSAVLSLATWNTMGWSARIDAYIKHQASKHDVIALTEVGAKV
jgi:hypothetical protein